MSLFKDRDPSVRNQFFDIAKLPVIRQCPTKAVWLPSLFKTTLVVLMVLHPWFKKFYFPFTVAYDHTMLHTPHLVPSGSQAKSGSIGSWMDDRQAMPCVVNFAGIFSFQLTFDKTS